MAIDAIPDKAVSAAFIPLRNSSFSLTSKGGAATVIAPGIAATNAHNAGLVDKKDVIGISRDYDLMFFRTRAAHAPARAGVFQGQRVRAYGHAAAELLGDGTLRMAQGTVEAVAAPVQPNCPNCPQSAFVFRGNAGPGFSGGPVVDARSGALLGIVFGYMDEDPDPDKWAIYAYHMHAVEAELARVSGFQSSHDLK